MPQGCLKGEDVYASLNSMCGMAVPQLVWVNVEPSGFAPLSADIPAQNQNQDNANRISD